MELSTWPWKGAREEAREEGQSWAPGIQKLRQRREQGATGASRAGQGRAKTLGRKEWLGDEAAELNPS
jgi:hypothetical protein